MFKYFRNIKNNNKVWQILNEKYFNGLNGNIGNTVLKISENPQEGNYLAVKTDNNEVNTILKSKESDILADINNSLGTTLSRINLV